MTSPTYDPTSGPVDPDVEQTDPPLGERTDPRRGEARPTGTFADSELENPEPRGAASAMTSRSPLIRGKLHRRYRQE